MAAYFSNHSQSRFLANSSPSAAHASHSASATVAAASNTSSSSTPRSRLPSKHFSTSVSTTAPDEHSRFKENVTKVNSTLSNNSPGNSVHPLRNTWVFWFRQQRAPGNKITNYEEGIKKISSFSSIESFWSLWTHLHPPSALIPTTDYLLFHSGVRRPVWEDPLNLSGGKWIIRLKKGVADRIWEDLVLAIIGDQFDECRITEDNTTESSKDGKDHRESGTDFPEICGCTISVRQSEDIVSLWNRVDEDVKVRERIRYVESYVGDTVRRVLNLPPTTIMEYKSNNDSMQDKSSFRNSAIDRMSLS